MRPWKATADGVTVRVRAQPGASGDAVAGIDKHTRGEVSLKVCVRAQAEKGKANAAVIETLARALKLAKSRFSLKSGSTARTKLIAVEGDPAQIIAALERLTTDH